ncbi:TPA: POTRA domain-containing protein [Providencia alcalifaciens]
MKRNSFWRYGALSFTSFATLTAFAEPHFPENTGRLLQHQIQQQQAQQLQFEAKAPEVSLSVPIIKSTVQFPKETPCFTIQHVSMTGQKMLPHWVPVQRLANQASGYCLGINGINLLVTDIQNRLIIHGWITTLVLIPEQDLSSGILALVVMPGKVQHIRFTDGSSTYSSLYTAIPAHVGDLLDLRDVGLDKGYLSGSDTLIVYVEKKDITGLKIPSGNEGGVNSHWLPGGYTSGGVAEATMNFSNKPNVTVIELEALKKQIQQGKSK